MATYQDQFYAIDPGNPPNSDSPLSPEMLVIQDRNNDNFISTNANDRIDGQRVTSVWRGDTITIKNGGGQEFTITGDTFYLSDGRSVFTPTDGSILHNATFVSSTYVNTSTQAPIGGSDSDFGPVCFASGTYIKTPFGDCAIESLSEGDIVITSDGLASEVLWVGAKTSIGEGIFAPVLFEAGAIGNKRPLKVSQQHRMHVSGAQVELLCGVPEALIAAKHLVNGINIRLAPQSSIKYFHILLDGHHLVNADGALCESFFPGDTILDQDREIHAQVRAAWGRVHPGESIEEMKTCLPVLRGPEARLLNADAELELDL